MNDLNKRAFEGLAQLLVAMALLLFLPAWTLAYWQAWLFLAVFGAAVLAITLYLMRHDRKLLERRVNAGPGAEKEKSQRTIQALASVAFIAVFVVSALDHRFGWSSEPTSVVVAGDVLVALGLLAVFFVFRANSYTSATIEVGDDQPLISTGPYAMVRHPMYAGAFVMLVGVPLALGSAWGLAPVAALAAVIVVRLLAEERFLTVNLPGYADYRRRVRYRLLPFVW